MPPFSLDLRDAITVITGIVTITGVIASQRSGLSKLADGQAALKAAMDESNRKIDAVHKRMDYYGQEIAQTKTDHKVLEERVNNIRDTQRMRARARLEAARAGETPMFLDEGGE